ncbi:uncharacterized protein [Anabrus simplex]|uniref:uncharacterized protein isoform X2 n=1 Tax=Anabrus simplex TaxID=316456 RepID=UPI0035A2746C
MPIEQIPGVHGGTVFHDGRGHIFRRQREFRGVTYMVCAHSTCPARGNMVANGDTIEETKPHNHDPDLDLPKALILRKRILQRCRKEKGSTRDIYREEIAKAGHLATHEVLCSMFSSLQRARSSVIPPCPPLPENLVQYKQLMEKPEYVRCARTLGGEPFLLDVVPSGHGDFSAIFMSPHMRKLLKECEVFHIDGTFRCVPKSPLCQQLTTITAMQDDNGFPVVLILMSKCSRMAYVTVLRRILQEEPEWQPSIVIADYENILQSALDEVFGTTGLTSVLGCWYQYTQALWRRLQTVPLLAEDSSALLGARMAMALPVLPSTLISSGLSEIVTFLMDELEGELWDQMLEFLQYVDEQWIEKYGGEKLSVNDLDHKLNYDIETLHHRIMVYMVNVKNGGQPGFWDFISGLQKFESDQSKILKTLEEKGKISKPRKKRHYQTQNKQIRDLCVKLYTRVISVREFLTSLTHRVYRACLWNGSWSQHYQGEGDDEAVQEEDNIFEGAVDIKYEVVDDYEKVFTIDELQEEVEVTEEILEENRVTEISEEEIEGTEELQGETEGTVDYQDDDQAVEEFQEKEKEEAIEDDITELNNHRSREEIHVSMQGSMNSQDTGTYYVLVIEDD